LDVTAIVAIVMVFGAPIAGGLVYGWMKMRLRHHEIELQEQKLAAEQQIRTDELNAKILKMDDFGLSPVEIASLAEARKVFDGLRSQSVRAGAGDPYIAAQVWWGPEGARYCDALGLDAMSAYAVAETKEHKERPYSDLARTDSQFWDSCKSTGKQVIPIVMTGWDGRPLMTDENEAKHYAGAWYLPAKPNAILIYAWNETAEGGWLVPALAEGTARLDAIGAVLRGVRK